MNTTQRTILTSVITVLVTLAVIALLVVSVWWQRGDDIMEGIAQQFISGVSSGQVATETQQDISQALNEESLVVSAVEEVSPAVVSVIATKEVPVLERFYRDTPFFGFRIPDVRQRGTEERQIGGGSGFIVSADGMIVTNRHVVEDAGASYTVLMKDGRRKDVEVVARDSLLDIAVLDMEGAGYQHLSFADSNDLKPGQSVIAIGNALGEFTNSVSTGVVSGLSRDITAGGFSGQPETLTGLIQTDAAINPGNSGGPLLNTRGEVIGVNVAMAAGSENIGFAIPSNDVADIVSSIKQTGEIRRPFLGVRYVRVTEEVQERFALEVDRGVLLIGGRDGERAVLEGSPAAQAGLESGDVITHVDGEEITDERSLATLIREHDIGEEVTLRVVRDGEEIEVRAVLENTPSPEA